MSTALRNRYGYDEKTTVLWQPAYGIKNEYINGVNNTTNLPKEFTTGSEETLMSFGMTGPSSPSPYVASASSTYSAYYPYKAFDGNTVSTDGFHAYQSSFPITLTLDMGNTYNINAYSVLSTYYSTQKPTAWQFRTSTNGSTWTTRDTQTGQSLGSSATKYTLSNSVDCRYIQLYITADGGYIYGGNHCTFVNELGVYRNVSSGIKTYFQPKSAVFDNTTSGSESRIQIKNSTGFRFGDSGTGNFMIFARVYIPSSISKEQTILYKGNDINNRFTFFFDTNNKINFNIFDSSSNIIQMTGSNTISEGWHNIGLTRFNSPSFSAMNLWVDDSNEATDTTTLSNTYEIPLTSNSLYIGYFEPDGSYSWNNPFQDLMIRNFVSAQNYFEYRNDMSRLFSK